MPVVTFLSDTAVLQFHTVIAYEYDAFGVEKNPDPNDTNLFRYCGEYFDKETGTIYLRARYYDPSIGRFITEDSYWGKDNDPLSLNLYTYCYSDPINNIDPTGNIVDTLADVGFLIWDVGDIVNDPSDWKNWASLGADAACAVVPFATGGGRAVKLATKGVEATKKLTTVEKALQAINKGEKLSTKMKDALRAQARNIMKKDSKNFLKAINKGNKLDVHHLIPIEYAELMGKGFNPNDLSNLYGVDKETHKLINQAWNDFKNTYKGSKITKRDVEEFAELTKKLYGDGLVK